MAGSTITINIDSEVLNKLRKLAEMQEMKKGFLGKVITEAVRKYIEEIEQEEIRKDLLRILKKGYPMGKLKIKHRDELYDRS